MDRRAVIPSLFGAPRALIGVIHVGALPGTPASRQGVDDLAEAAVAEARQYQAAGYQGLVIETITIAPT
jgi:predicted TIM-barrel enzyme